MKLKIAYGILITAFAALVGVNGYIAYMHPSYLVTVLAVLLVSGAVFVIGEDYERQLEEGERCQVPVKPVVKTPRRKTAKSAASTSGTRTRG